MKSGLRTEPNDCNRCNVLGGPVDLSFFSFFNTANGDIPVPKKPIHYLSKQDFLKDFLLEVVVAKDMEWAPVFY